MGLDTFDCTCKLFLQAMCFVRFIRLDLPISKVQKQRRLGMLSEPWCLIDYFTRLGRQRQPHSQLSHRIETTQFMWHMCNRSSFRFHVCKNWPLILFGLPNSPEDQKDQNVKKSGFFKSIFLHLQNQMIQQVPPCELVEFNSDFLCKQVTLPVCLNGSTLRNYFYTTW